MPIRILCLGDMVGKPGRLAVAEVLPTLVRERKIDLVIANVENAAGGSGLTPPIFQKILASGVDVCTLGDHTYRKREVLGLLEQSDRLIRPGNFPPGAIGKGWCVATTHPSDGSANTSSEGGGGVKVAVLQIMGRTHINVPGDDPFRTIDRMLAEIPRDIKVRVVDFHAEVSSEKVAMGWYVNGKVSLIFGTHTHTPTADARVLPVENGSGGTAFISDLGMTGPYDSVLGRRKDRVLKHLLTGMPQFFEVATGDPRVCGIIATIDEVSGMALAIERCDTKGTEQAGAYDNDDRGQASSDM
ncbi:MAG: TIGR00282 family metallophosphoesterase [Phycisphaerae bacterium]